MSIRRLRIRSTGLVRAAVTLASGRPPRPRTDTRVGTAHERGPEEVPHPRTPGALAPSAAARLFVVAAAGTGLTEEDLAVAELVARCGHHPLAVRLTGARLRHQPSRPLGSLTAELAVATGRPATGSGVPAEVSAAFHLAYRDLGLPEQRLLRRIGLVPGPDLDVLTAAALVDSDPSTVGRLLDGLLDRHLLEEPDRGRYRLPGPLREPARVLAFGDGPNTRAAAVNRLLDHYLACAATADRHLARRPLLTAGRLAPGADRAPDLSTPERAIAWLQEECANLQAAVEFAVRHGRHTHAVLLPAALHAFLRGRGHWQEARILHHLALDSATVLGHRPGRAETLLNLAELDGLTGGSAAAEERFGQALELYRGLADRTGEAYALSGLGRVQESLSRYGTAVETHQAALHLHLAAGDRLGQAAAMVGLARAQRALGDHAQATQNLQPALELFDFLNSRPGRADANLGLGVVGELTGQYQAAAARHWEAVSLYAAVGDRLGQADALSALGRMQQLMGQYAAAVASHREALEIHRALGHDEGRADILLLLGDAHLALGETDGAEREFTGALELHRGAGRRRGELDALFGLGRLDHAAGRPGSAVARLSEVVSGYHELGVRSGEARALAQLGEAQRSTGEHEPALQSLWRALSLSRDLQDPGAEATALNLLGRLLAETGWSNPHTHYAQARDLACELPLPHQEMLALEGAGISLCEEGERTEGEIWLRSALGVAERLGTPDAGRIRARLDGLTRGPVLGTRPVTVPVPGEAD
ncbi:tetratricopeptide repeat protein [Kitasatospora sp. NPDC058162]|uniref:tetratricopeptide repeat protein n=1 Tax=Kitasatospora sp. NPDC058162 TaxID=3346362 RepID=UPI0036D81486